MKNYELVIASDHAGFELKSAILAFLQKSGYRCLDLGCDSADIKVDYPDYAQKLTAEIIDNNAECGILICGTGIGMSIAANRFSGIRAALCINEFMATRAKAHNNANVLVLGSNIVESEAAIGIVKAFLAGKFEGGRHLQRIEKL